MLPSFKIVTSNIWKQLLHNPKITLCNYNYLLIISETPNMLWNLIKENKSYPLLFHIFTRKLESALSFNTLHNIIYCVHVYSGYDTTSFNKSLRQSNPKYNRIFRESIHFNSIFKNKLDRIFSFLSAAVTCCSFKGFNIILFDKSVTHQRQISINDWCTLLFKASTLKFALEQIVYQVFT